MNISTHVPIESGSASPDEQVSLRLPIRIRTAILGYRKERKLDWAKVWKHAFTLYLFVLRAKQNKLELRFKRSPEVRGAPWHISPLANFTKADQAFKYGRRKSLPAEALLEANSILESMFRKDIEERHVLQSALDMLQQFIDFQNSSLGIYAGEVRFELEAPVKLTGSLPRPVNKPRSFKVDNTPETLRIFNGAGWSEADEEAEETVAVS